MPQKVILTLAVLVLILVSAGCVPAATPANKRVNVDQPQPAVKFKVENDETLALVNGTLIDGASAEPLPEAVVVVRQGRIIAVGARAKVTIPPEAKIIDIQGGTILPGFINAHVHQGYNTDHLRAWVQAGVTTVCDLGSGPGEQQFTRRDEFLQDNRLARLVSAGPIVTVPDGYPMVPWGAPGLPVESPEDAVQKTNRLLDGGADIIKIAIDSGRVFRRKIPVLSPEEAAAIVKVAHQRRTLVAAHITHSQDLGPSLNAGVDDVAHMVTDPLSDELIARMVTAKVYWTPTLELWQRVGSGYSQAVINLRRFVRAGGLVALGTDYAGYTGQFDLGLPVQEISGLQQAGLTPMQIIVAATQNAARVCNLDHELGTLEPGKIADILVVSGDPLRDMGALARPYLVVHNGVVIRSGQ